MRTHVFRVWLLPNPPRGFDPETDVWRELAVDDTHTLAEFHEAIRAAFDREADRAYEFLTRDDAGIATRSYLHPALYEGGPSWPPMEPEEIDRAIAEAVPDDAPAAAREKFRELRLDPPPAGDAAETTIGDLDFEEVRSLHYQFDIGNAWNHYIEPRETSGGTAGGEPRLVDEQGDAPESEPEE